MKLRRCRRWGGFASAALLAAALLGCATARPEYAPVAPFSVEHASPAAAHLYDLDGDGRAEYREQIAVDGAVTGVAFRARDGADPGQKQWSARSWPPAAAGTPHLIIVLDSVPYKIVRELHDAGRFRLFHAPARVVAPFPVMTDLSLAEFFGCSPCPGAESLYLRDGRLVDPVDEYLSGRNMPWLKFTDYSLDAIAHPSAYSDPRPWFEHELGRIQERSLPVLESGGTYVGYVVGTSAWGSRVGRDGHQTALLLLDRFCRWMVARLDGRLNITLLSDHGHNLVPSRRVRLGERLREIGYRVGDRLDALHDVVVPEWGNVSYAAIHTPHAPSVAADVIGFEGVDLAAYRDDEEVCVLSRAGRARIERCDGGLRYICETGDPLEIGPQGAAGQSACLNEAAWFESTANAVQVDGVVRLWRAFHGLMQFPPDVLVALDDGYFSGSSTIAAWLEMAAVHGNLRAGGTYAFAMTTAGELPPRQRMADLAAALRGLGLSVPGLNPLIP